MKPRRAVLFLNAFRARATSATRGDAASHARIAALRTARRRLPATAASPLRIRPECFATWNHA
jgi:tRNA(Arg) A34 adenosine deaminase TadA